DFARASRRLPEEQRRGVGTGDDQHDANDAPQEVQHQANVTHQSLLQWYRGHAAALVAVRVLLLEAGPDRVQLDLCRLERDTRLEPRDGEKTVARPAGGAIRLRLGRPD